jgi:type II secretory pathway pseudopilin PulG
VRRLRSDAGSRGTGQRGFALIAILALAAMISAFLIASALNRSSTDISNEREDRSMSALRRAKAALINYAASEQWQAYKGQATSQPGGLPCPDTDPDTNTGNTGVSSLGCSGAGANRVGRFPFATIGADDLRDASGERLWYAVSSNFYKNVGVNKINSDTPGLLTVTGTAPASNVVAIVFAPGPAIQDSTLPGQIQNRSAANYNRIASYLENFATGTDYTFASSAFPSQTFNDRLLMITQAELMAAVEPVVAARIERDIAPRIQDYYGKWGVYPFPVPFNPTTSSQSAYQGNAAQNRGLLPVTRSAVQWQTSSISATVYSAATSGSPTVSLIDCSSSSSSQINCRIDYGTNFDDRPGIQIQATLQNVAFSFPDTLKVEDAAQTNRDGDPLDTTQPGFGQWSASGSPQYPPNVSNVLLSTGHAQITFRGRLQNPQDPSTGTGGRVRIRINVPAYLPLTDGSDPTYGWFAANEWYRQTYYAVSPGFLLGNGNSCTPLPSPPLPPTPPYLCLRVNNLRSSYATANDKRAILVLAGRALNGTTRPTATPGDYFENANLTAVLGTAPFVYENRVGNPTSTNDRVVVISP